MVFQAPQAEGIQLYGDHRAPFESSRIGRVGYMPAEGSPERQYGFSIYGHRTHQNRAKCVPGTVGSSVEALIKANLEIGAAGEGHVQMGGRGHAVGLANYRLTRDALHHRLPCHMRYCRRPLCSYAGRWWRASRVNLKLARPTA